MGIVWTVLIGFVVGVIAKLIVPGVGPRGFFLTSVLGIAGALVMTYAGHYLGWYRAGETTGFIGALVGAVVLLIAYHFAFRDRS
jgi:uncharacterized membrane protein YeaQ/YmgE (transglycosylase-associated protein family)